MTRIVVMLTVMIFQASWLMSPLAAQTTRELSKQIIKAGNALTPFPPSFLGHPWVYAGALFAQLTIFSFALAVIFFLISVTNLSRDGMVKPDGTRTWQSPVNIYRVSIALYMVTVVFGITGNLLTYLAWNEASAETMTVYFTIDKALKACAIVPFLRASYLLVKHDEVITYHLATHNPAVPLWPTNEAMKEHRRTIFWVFVMSIGVTYAKWGAHVGL